MGMSIKVKNKITDQKYINKEIFLFVFNYILL